MFKFKYTIPIIPSSLNRYAGRENKWEYRKDKALWLEYIAFCCRPIPKKPITNAKVTLKYYFRDKKRRDPDNYSGKFILDGLVKNGVIKDDSFNNISLFLEAGYDKDNSRTEIIVEGVT